MQSAQMFGSAPGPVLLPAGGCQLLVVQEEHGGQEKVIHSEMGRSCCASVCSTWGKWPALIEKLFGMYWECVAFPTEWKIQAGREEDCVLSSLGLH